MDIDFHDRVFGFVSHLPHVLAYSLVDALLSEDDSDTLFNFAGGGLRDYTRIAASSPEMWCEIFNANRENIISAIEHLKASLGKIEKAIADEDPDTLGKILSNASHARRKYMK